MHTIKWLLACTLFATTSGLQAQARFQIDPALPDYRRAENVSGKLTSVGSSTLTQLLNRWSDDLRRIYPGLELEVTGGGSGSAPPALLEARADLAPMSRPMNAAEIAAFRAKFGYAPTQVTVGLDALAIYVNKNNPLKQISLRELDAIYSVSRKRGGAEIKTWGQLGLLGDWAQQPIRVFGPQSTHGMYSLFRADVLQGGEYRYDMRAEPVASAIAQGVGADNFAIGFASHVFLSARARPLAVAEEPGSPAIEPTQTTVASNQYPLARSLYIYINRKPGAPLSPALAEFITFICSKQGQSSAVELGNYPLTAALAQKECLEALK
ncbi:MAG: PstS family phosphate ABC transporter substrate-binding protein [Burkholderiaceae bacterium]